MGVVHKLREEVVSFMITKKQENPRLSCRGLVAIVNEQFQINVSKSSVNAILKDSQLSSAVGRRPLEEKGPRKFKIPPQKKSELFGSKKLEEVKLAPVNPAIPLREPAPKMKEPIIKEPPTTVVPQKHVAIEKRIEISEEESAPSKAFSNKKVLNRGILYDGMGNFFLKAAQWELSSSPIIGKFLNKYLNGKIATDLNSAGDVLLFCRQFGINKLELIGDYQNHGLWALCGLNDKIDYQIFASMLGGINDLGAISLQIANDNILLFTEISQIKIGLEDRTEVYIDAQYNSVGNLNVQSGLSAPLDKSLQYLSSLIVNNVKPLVIRSIPGRTEFSPAFFGLLSAFENLEGKKIKKVAICDNNYQEIAEFSIIPNKKRNFIIGAWPWQREFSQYMSEDNHNIKSLYFGELDQEVYYSDLKTKYFHEHLGGKQSLIRVILLRESKGDTPTGAVVTNILEGQMSSEDIVTAYCSRWPNLQNGYKDIFTRTKNYLTQQSGSRDALEKRISSSFGNDPLVPTVGLWGFWLYIEQLLVNLHEYCLKHYFPSEFDGQDPLLAKERIYGLPGYLKKVQNALVVTLVVPDAYLHQKELEYAIRRVNESDIRNGWGGKLVLELDAKY